MEYKLKGGWTLKELRPAVDNPTCRVFKLLEDRPVQIYSEYDAEHKLIITVKASRTSISFRQSDELIAKKDTSLGTISVVTYSKGAGIYIVTE